ncbi:hypothetical protein P154DRAFT_521555 [Amniculicola lignicola CBS 123094]|uniref:Uncharacterized protein n=1 Tax=Amniculicola lignicola CBS 123094 TaxID=1392246 RepID=A0A6A5WLD7_9PLEO|nr:hypothetical protein P154DRAFT_521555 [Amniculicola lignicola CBS 123094]
MEMWSLKLKTTMSGTQYLIDVAPSANLPAPLSIDNKVLGHEKGILLSGNPVAVMSRSEAWEHLRRQDVVSVAPGMDILLAMGVAWVRVEKQTRDTINVIGAI